ncbi:hypothetical protein [Brevibacterium litoralis]|uniref:hypothetical protein n=1 Tax=Brevibacterium litoralis TaxID=3138935 RepID=UPI0032EE0F68
MIDTSVFTHIARAEHLDTLRDLAPGEIVVIPTDVHDEIQRGRELHTGIPDPSALPWLTLTALSDEEVLTQLQVKAELGGSSLKNLGECAVIACAEHRGLTALLDDRQAIAQAKVHGVPHHDTLWLVIEAYATTFDHDRTAAEQMVDDLLATDMYLPVDSGESLFAWAYTEGLLPR